MSYQVLARKWRPHTFDELVGQTHVVRALVNALDKDRLHHAYLFTGTRGVGKTTIARIFAKALNCETGVSATPCGECSSCQEIDEGRFVDLIEVDAASRTKVDETRELLDNVQYAPTRGRYKVYLIDEVHMFSNHSFNALLKTLEEPPPHVKFLLATTEQKKLPVTILSRCLQFNLKRLNPIEIEAQLRSIIDAESIPADDRSLRLIADAADGSVRDALSLLDQAIAYGAGSLAEEEVSAMLGTVNSDQIFALLESLADGDAASLLQQVKTMADFGTDFNLALNDLLTQLQAIAITQVLDAPDQNSADADRIKEISERINPEDCQLFYQIGLIGRRDLNLAPDPKGGFEMTLLRMLTFKPADSAPTEPTVRKQSRAKKAPEAGRAAARAALERSVDDPKAGVAPNMNAESGVETNPDKWPELIERLGLVALERELAMNCVMLDFDNRVLRLSLRKGHENLLNSKLEGRIVERVRGCFGEDARLDIQIGDTDARTPVEQGEIAELQRQSEAEQAIAKDPNVQAIVEKFGGRVSGTNAR